MLASARELTVARRRIVIDGTWIRIAHLADEWHDDLHDPESFVGELQQANARIDLFTFWQRLPDTEPRYGYHRESEQIAALPVTTYEHWFRRQINNKTRNLIGKATKRGVTVQTSAFDEQFVSGMVNIFNESPIRQGRPFWHYGKDYETVKREFSTYLHRERVVGAYLGGELIGFMFLVDAGRFAMLGQILSMIRHRDKAPNNLLIAKAVEICAERQVPFLVYAGWPRPGSLRDFKRHNAFDCVELPRYYIPLTSMGRVALRLKLHQHPVDHLPDGVILPLTRLRSRFFAWRYGSTLG